MPTTIAATIAEDPVSLGEWSLVGAASLLEALDTANGDTECIASVEPSFAPAIVSREVEIPAGAYIVGGPVVISARAILDESPGIGVTLKLDGSNIGQYGATLTLGYSTHSGNAVAGSTVQAGASPQVLTAEIQAPSPFEFNGARASFLQFGVTYNRPPNAPTLTSPSGSVVGLTPVFTGTHSDPDGDAMSGVEIEVRRVSDNALMWASGMISTGTFSRSYAGSTLVSGTQYKWRARTRDNSNHSPSNVGAWSDFTTFTPVTNTPPTASVISPTGNPTLGTLTPTLQFSYSDPDGNSQGGYQVQVRRFSDQVSMWDPGQQAGAVTSVAYAGTTLVGGTRYEWRVRVQDSAGAWSDYTGWASFTPQAVPNAPTLSSPSGLTNTLTPTIQGSYSQGAGATEAAFQYEVRQGAVTIYSSGDVATAIATGQAYGTNNASDTPATPPALAWGTAYQVRARSKDSNGAYSEWSDWQAFTTNAAPTTPTNLQPANAAVLGDTTPTLSWTHNDPDSDAQTEADIELRTVSGDTPVTGYDPKTLVQATGTHNVTETLTASPATEYKWRVRTKGASGPGFGPWSSFRTFTISTAPTVTVSEPDPEEAIPFPGYTVEWTMSGGSGTQQSYRVRVYADDQATIVYDSGVQSGDDTEFTLPAGFLRNARSYYIEVSVEDTLSQAASSGLIPVTTDWTPPGTITGLTVQALGDQT